MTAQKPVGPLPMGGRAVPELSTNELEVLQRSAVGATYGEIARALSFTEKSVGNMAMRMCQKLGAENITHAVYLACQAGVLAVQPRPRQGEVVIDDTMRLLHSLIAAGWTLTAIAGRMGMKQCELSHLMRRSQCTPLMAGRVERVFLELYGLDPLEQGAHPRGVARSLNLARSMGWTVVPDAEVDAMRGAFRYAA